MTAWHNYLLGAWQFTRNIDNGARAKGLVTCSKTHTQKLLYKEAGELILPDDKTLSAQSQYILEAAPREIIFNFPDGRLFQSFALDVDTFKAPATSQHLCGEDTYISALTLLNQNTFTLTHNVTGPRKNYTSTTVYTRQPSQV